MTTRINDISSIDAETARQMLFFFRGGNVPIRWHEPTKDYGARWNTQGLSKREIIRCLKHYLARKIDQVMCKTFPLTEVISP